MAIVDAYDDPNAEADLAEYRNHYGLPPCTTANGCFQKIDQDGGTYFPTPDEAWATEISLDLDMVSAMCPNCHILLVEAYNEGLSNLALAEDEAASLGADVISNSYGALEGPGVEALDPHFDHPGVAITVASGDIGYYTEYPAVSPDVTAVGGTSLQQASDTGSRDATETAWVGSGSGCSEVEPKPSWQHDPDCPRRSVADVSAVADPATPVWVYDTYPYPNKSNDWGAFGGTSASAPVVAAMYALAEGPSGSANSPAGYPYAHPGSLNDVTSGSPASYCPGSYLCAAGAGYDGLTGLGTPNGVDAFTPAVPSAPQDLATGSYSGTAVLSWKDPATNGGADISEYRIYRADQGSNPIATVGGAATSYTNTGLTNNTTYDYTVKAVNAVGVGPQAAVSATPKPLDHLTVSPVTPPTIAAGGDQAFTVEGFATSNQSQSLGDETPAAVFSIGPNGSCAGATCTAGTAGDHTVRASLSGKTGTRSLHVTAGPLDHLALSPDDSTIAAGGSQSYGAEGFDAFDNSLGNELPHLQAFSIDPDGSCSGATCSPGADGDHTVRAPLKYTSVAAGADAVCAVTDLGGLKCWGANGESQLGNTDVSGSCTGDPSFVCSAVPVDVFGLTAGVTSVSADIGHACAVTVAGAAKCWGWNNNGWLGNGTLTGSLLPEDVVGLTSGMAAISTGFDHTCALTTGGGVKCWGANHEYEGPGGLGDGTPDDSLVPVDVSGLGSGIAAISMGTGFSCGLTTGGGVKCWGANAMGQLGDGDQSTCTASPLPCSLVPVDVTGLTSGVTQIAAGYRHACALTTAGGVKCWGDNEFGALGNGTSTGPQHCFFGPKSYCSRTPVDVSGLTSGVVAISANEQRTCAVLSSGGVKCWGWNFRGMLGDGSSSGPETCTVASVAERCSTTPVDVSGLTDVSAVDLGNFHACAITTTHAVRCWGLMGLGELGNGTTTDNLTSSPPADANATQGVAALHVGPPDTVLDSGPPDLSTDNSPSFEFHSNEGGATFECRLDPTDGVDWHHCDSPVTYQALPDNAYTFEVRATHSLTGTDATPASSSFTIDTVPPPLAIGGPSGPTNDNRPVFQFNAQGNPVQCSIDQGTPDFGACTWSNADQPPAPLADGPYTFRAKATDPAGNETIKTLSFTVDTIPPTTKITLSRIRPALRRARFTFTSSEPGSRFMCALDSHNRRCSSPKLYENLKRGWHKFRVYAIDPAGNYDHTPSVRRFLI